MFDAPYEELLKVNGVGESAAALIKLIPQLTRRYMVDKADEEYLNTTEKPGSLFCRII